MVEDSIGGGITDALKSYGVPLATVALCGVGAVYFAKRMSDLETKVDAGRRNDVRHLNETDVRLIVQQMAKDGLINVPQWSPQNQAGIVSQKYQDNVANQSQQQQLAQQQYLIEQRAAQAKAQQAQQQIFLQQQQHAQAQQAHAPTSFPVAATAWKPKGAVQEAEKEKEEDE